MTMLVRARAPLRLGLAGGGTDLPAFSDVYGGAVLNATVDLHAHATIEPADEPTLLLEALDRREVFRGVAESFLTPDGELDLHKGVYNRIVRQFNGGRPLPLILRTYCDAPAGSGLGSSSTLVVAIIKAFAEWLHLPLGEYEIAELAYEIERIDLGLNGGRQDQYAAAFGGFNFIEFPPDGRVIVNPLRIKEWIVSELESSLVVFYTGQSRESAVIIQEQTDNLRTEKKVPLDAMLRLKEEAFAMKESILKGDLVRVGHYLNASWEAKKRTARAVSNDRLDRLYEIAAKAGAQAGKVSGAGGGGFMIFLVEPVHRMEVIRALEAEEGQVIHCHFTSIGTQSWCICR